MSLFLSFLISTTSQRWSSLLVSQFASPWRKLLLAAQGKLTRSHFVFSWLMSSLISKISNPLVSPHHSTISAFTTMKRMMLSRSISALITDISLDIVWPEVASWVGGTVIAASVTSLNLTLHMSDPIQCLLPWIAFPKLGNLSISSVGKA